MAVPLETAEQKKGSMPRFDHIICRCLLAITAILTIGTGLLHANAEDGKKLDRLRARAEQGYIDQQMELANVYLSGRGVPQNLPEAARWFKRAAELGNPVAANTIGFFYQQGIGIRADPERAEHWFQMAAASGSSLAKVNLGLMYLQGLGVHQNLARAREYFQRASECGVGLADAYLGDMELTGAAGRRDVQAAEHWFAKGVKRHDPVSAYYMAYLYSSTPDHPHDFSKTTSLLRWAAEKGYIPAMHSLGYFLEAHPDLQRAPDEARKVLGEASESGYWRSSAFLGALKVEGKLVKADPAEAYYYFELASLQGGEAVRLQLEAAVRLVVPQVSPAEQVRQQKRADDAFLHQRMARPLLFAELPGGPAAAGHDSALLLPGQAD